MDTPAQRILSWEDYPEPRLVLVRGKLVVEVSIPRPIRHLFGSGNGKTNNRRLTTGTTDQSVAKRKMWALAHEIYKQFDAAQLDAQQGLRDEVDGFALDTISALVKSFKYNRGEAPELNTTTPYAELRKLKDTLDSYFQMMVDQAPPIEAVSASLNAMDEALQSGVAPVKAREKMLAALGDTGSFTMEQNALLSKNSSSIIQSYWEDLLTTAARDQGIEVPVFEGRSSLGIAEYEGMYLPEGVLAEANEVSRPRRVKSKETMRISDVKADYFITLEANYDKLNTRRKWTRAVDLFVEMMGDLPLREIKPVTCYQFAQKQVDVTPTISNATVTNYHTGMSLLLKYCVRKGYLDVNPFLGVDVKEYGKSKQSWLPFSTSDLDSIFSYEWPPQERLLLNIISSTGMRATEAGSLAWDRFNDTDYEGVRYFSLIDTENEDVSVKNAGSARHVPLHPDLVLPEKGEGRLFNYTIDDNGLCSSSAGHIINPVLNRLAPHKRKSTHSFRRTLKVMLRDAGVSKEINDIYTGHGSGDVSGKSYGGASIRTRFDAISKLDLPWLK